MVAGVERGPLYELRDLTVTRRLAEQRSELGRQRGTDEVCSLTRVRAKRSTIWRRSVVERVYLRTKATEVFGLELPKVQTACSRFLMTGSAVHGRSAHPCHCIPVSWNPSSGKRIVKSGPSRGRRPSGGCSTLPERVGHGSRKRREAEG